eukprot:TRINITY_DN3380_c0_g1_i1.p1 TRINITY_DN3380_c0_g1~~TRINITY_DN3380_c0_g1_i1.p1  ORF type:complete len:447 (+),score=55.57 TRINITY_DN3380_c0_g1_i1:1093-2433(+)
MYTSSVVKMDLDFPTKMGFRKASIASKQMWHSPRGASNILMNALESFSDGDGEQFSIIPSTCKDSKAFIKMLEAPLGECHICLEAMLAFLKPILVGKSKSILTTDEVYIWKIGSVEGAEEVLIQGGFEKQGSELIWASSQQALKTLTAEIENINSTLVHKIQRIKRKPVLGPKKLSRAFYNLQGSCRFPVGFSDTQGGRPTMEDEIVILGMGPRIRPDEDYFAVFDGHGGQEGSNYAARFLHLNLDKNLRKNLDLEETLKITFKETNDTMCGTYAMQCGTCALVIFIKEDIIYAANLGDSRAVMGCRGKVAVRLTRDHKPSDPEEIKRIEELGGFVKIKKTARVQGMLAVSRALGDKKYIPYVSSDPGVTQTKITDDTLFLVLACDGIWDEVSDQEVVEIIYQSKNPQDSANKVKELAASRKSQDNISVIVIYLKNRTEWDDAEKT